VEREPDSLTSKLIIKITLLYDVWLNFWTGTLLSQICLAQNLRALDIRKSDNIYSLKGEPKTYIFLFVTKATVSKDEMGL